MNTTNQSLILETGHDPGAAVIWLHGLGADGHDFESIVPMLELPASLPVRFVFPHAPVRPITVNGGMSMRGWYDIRSLQIDQSEDEAGIRASSTRLAGLVDEQLERGIPSERVVLAGFSQGGAIALFAALRSPRPLAGVLALSTYLPCPERLATELAEAGAGLPIFMGHGTHDPIVPLALGQATCGQLRGYGIDVEFHSYPMAHTLCVDEIADVSRWLRRVLGR